jgi:hypothetical protein
VTGYFDFPWRTLRVTRNAFGTDRVYEAGEILSLPRYRFWLFSNFLMPASRADCSLRHRSGIRPA